MAATAPPRAYVLDSDGSQTRDGLNARTINAYLEEHARTGKPFFLAAGFHKPHLPWTAPRRFFDLYPSRQHRRASVAGDAQRSRGRTSDGTQRLFAPRVARRGHHRLLRLHFVHDDENVGMLLDTLDRTKLWETTVVVFLSDNGWHLGDHGGLWSKLTLFENGTRVPLIFARCRGAAWQGGDTPRRNCSTFTPRSRRLAGLKTPAGLEGKSLVPAMRSDQASTRRARVQHDLSLRCCHKAPTSSAAR